MKLKYKCGCEYGFSFRRGSNDTLYPEYVDDDGYDFELCEEHKKGYIKEYTEWLDS